MGETLEREVFDDGERGRFARRLEDSVGALRELLDRPGFGEGPTTIGAELELDLVDEEGRPVGVNREVLQAAVDDRVSLEIDRFNLEINARPLPLEGRPFAALEADLTDALHVIEAAARRHGAGLVTIGILPTLGLEDLSLGALSDEPRYRALAREVARARGGPGHMRIEGAEEVAVPAHEISIEGATTSLQVHLRVAPGDFARTYDAAQIATGFVLAVSGNSPFFLERRLWDETRIALFQRSADDRQDPQEDDARPARVSFGHGWVRGSAIELFEESVAFHEPLLPRCSDEDPRAALADGRVPRLAELRLHQGTVWRWNRAIFDPADGGHLRIEMRALPSGPTVADMVANATLLLGLTLALARDADRLTSRLTFGQARRNFYLAARLGVDATLLWPTLRGHSPVALDPTSLAEEVTALAEGALVQAGVHRDDVRPRLSLLRDRIATRGTGAKWQSRVVAELERRMSRPRALSEMLRRYRELSASGRPAHEW